MMMGSSTGDGHDHDSELAAFASPKAAAATASIMECEGVEFTVTERNEVAAMGGGGVAPRVLDGESFLDASTGTGTRHHFVDVQGRAEAMLFLVSVREDQRRIVAVSRCC